MKKEREGHESTVGQVGVVVFQYGTNADILITTNEASIMLNRSVRRVQQLIDEGQLIAVKISRDYLVFQSSVLDFVKTLD